jgi:hypothetical protein
MLQCCFVFPINQLKKTSICYYRGSNKYTHKVGGWRRHMTCMNVD